MGIRSEVGANTGATGVRGPGREQEAGLLQFAGNGSELSDSGADGVANCIVTKDPVTPTTTTKGRSPQRSSTSPHSPQAASQSQTGMRRRRCKATLKRGEGMCVSREAGVAVSQAPAPGARQASRWRQRSGRGQDPGEAWRQCGPRSCPTGTSEKGRRTQKRHWYQRNDGIEGGLGRSETAPLVKVQGVKGGPDGGAEIAACGEAANLGSRSSLAGRAPIVVRKRGANEASEGRADVGVSGEEAAGCASGGTVRHE